MTDLNPLRLAACSAIAFFAPSVNASYSETPPVGVSVVSIKSGNTPIAPAYVHPDAASLEIDSLSRTGEVVELSFSNLEAGDGAYAPDRYPRYYLEVIKEGAFAGMYFDVDANTAQTITVRTWDGGSLQPFAAGDTVIVRKHMTLGDFFEDAEETLAAYVDVVKFFEAGNVSHSILWDGNRWTRDFVHDDSEWPIYPGQGFLCLFGSNVRFVSSGHVKTTPTQIPVYNGSNNFVGTFSPVETTFADLEVTNWMDPYTDSFKLLSSDGSLMSRETLIFDGSKLTSDFLSDNGNTTLAPNESFLLLPVVDTNWIQPAPYVAQ
jgi:hypothetical protein